MNNISSRLQILLKTKKITPLQFAEDMNISIIRANQYIDGLTMPSVDTLIRLADYFNVTVDFLLERTYCCENFSLCPISNELFNFALDPNNAKFLRFAQDLKNKNINPDSLMQFK